MACQHLNEAPQGLTAQVKDQVCQDCVAMGKRDWVQLRLCLTCGHVGCCDSSPSKHATQHFHDTQHPVMQSFIPNQTWMWCYLDEQSVDPGEKVYVLPL